MKMKAKAKVNPKCGCSHREVNHCPAFYCGGRVVCMPGVAWYPVWQTRHTDESGCGTTRHSPLRAAYNRVTFHTIQRRLCYLKNSVSLPAALLVVI